MGTKPRASGSDAVVLLAKETVYGTPPDGTAGAVYFRPPISSDDASAAQGLEDDDSWNMGTAEDGDAALGAFAVAGDLVVPMDVRGIGFFLTMALGPESAPVDNEDGTFTHTWNSTKDLFSYTKQVGHPKLSAPKWRTQLGCKAGGFSFPMARTGRAKLTVPLIGQGEVKDTTGARDASPRVDDYLPLDNAKGSVLLDGAPAANLTAAQFNFSTGLDAVDAIRPDYLISGADETKRKCSGSANIRMGADHTIDDLVDGHIPAPLTFGFKLASNAAWGLTILLPRVFFERTKVAIGGPGGIDQSTTWRAARDATAGFMLQATLVNDVEAYS
jgi:hypothetical protein